MKGRRAVCEWLVEEGKLGAAHMQADEDGNTPAHMARLEGFTQLATWLELAAAQSTANAQASCARGCREGVDGDLA